MDENVGAGNLIVNGFPYTPTGVSAGFYRRSGACFVERSRKGIPNVADEQLTAACRQKGAYGDGCSTADQEVLSGEINESLERSR
ncbi:MAG TPA: hypothetical protein VKF36_00125 [Syntrophorhabdales bacterium]|nr:hypothetical protein [Syntrophorhabdales bacterium]